MNKPLIRQIWTISGVLLNIVGLGFMLGYPACILPALKSKDSDIVANSELGSWIASCVGLSSIPGLLVSCYSMNRYGRKISHALSIVPGAIGWFIIYFSKDVTTIIIGRIFCGIASGATVVLGAIVIGEYSNPDVRGVFLNLKTAATCTGIIAVHISGNYYHWRTVALIGSVPLILAILITFTWPESPSWLITKNRLEESQSNFYWLRGNTKKSTIEFNDMQIAQLERLSTQKDNTVKDNIVNFFKAFAKREFIKPVLIIAAAFILLEACGRHTFPAYAIDIINGINKDKSQTFYYTLCIDIITTSTTLFSAVIVKVCKKRLILFASGVSSLIVLLIICLYLFLVSKGTIENDRPWIPLSLFAFYFVLANLGCTPIPLALLGELFPLAYRSIATAVSGVIMSSILMLALKVTPALMDSVDVYGTLTIFAAFMAATLLYLFFNLPETKSRTLQEIEEFFLYGEFQDRHRNMYDTVLDKDIDNKK